jgi:Flp pilus assembly pilin Flp
MPTVDPSVLAAESCSPLARLVRDQRGAATVEYIIIAGMIAIACILGFKSFGDAVLLKVKGQTTAIGTVVETPTP